MALNAEGLSALSKSQAGQNQKPDVESNSYKPLIWPSTPPAGIPFPKSESLKGIRFTGRFRDYTDADTWFPTWAQDGNLYSPFMDGAVEKPGGWKIIAGGGHGKNATQGYAKVVGNDPLNLSVIALGKHSTSALPYGGRYASACLSYNGVWYYGTYCVDMSLRFVDGIQFSWGSLEPFVGFMTSRDYGRTWEENPHAPWSPLFPEVGNHSAALKALAERKRDWRTSDVRNIIHCLPEIKIGTPHFADFGQNMEHSPDGRAYLVGHGSIEPDPMPRFANNNWIAGDQIFMARVIPSLSNINDVTHYEFFGGHDRRGMPIWTSDFSKILPLVDWNNHCGCVTLTFNKPLQKYLMCIADAWPGTQEMNTYILESSHVTGPWKLVTYMAKFGTQAYFVNIPSKFISEDGRKCWLCYASNYTRRKYPVNPPGSRYAMCLHEIELL